MKEKINTTDEHVHCVDTTRCREKDGCKCFKRDDVMGNVP